MLKSANLNPNKLVSSGSSQHSLVDHHLLIGVIMIAVAISTTVLGSLACQRLIQSQQAGQLLHQLMQPTNASIIATTLDSNVVCQCSDDPSNCCSLINDWTVTLLYLPDSEMVIDDQPQLVIYQSRLNLSTSDILQSYQIGDIMLLYYNVCPLSPLSPHLLELCQGLNSDDTNHNSSNYSVITNTTSCLTNNVCSELPSPTSLPTELDFWLCLISYTLALAAIVLAGLNFISCYQLVRQVDNQLNQLTSDVEATASPITLTTISNNSC